MHFENSCRLCLKDLSDVLFDEDSHVSMAEDKSLQRMVLECFQIQVTDGETVSKVCGKCNTEIRMVHKIRKRIRKADFEIKQYYATLVKEEDVGLEEEEFDDIQRNVQTELVQTDSNDYEEKPDVLRLENHSNNDDDDHYKKYEFIEVEPHFQEHQSIIEDTTDDESERKSAQTKKQRKKRNPSNAVNNPEVRKKTDSKCYICASEFETTEMLDSHLGTHVGSSSPICNLCDFPATTVRSLNMHLRTIHFRKGKRIPCDECKKSNTVREFSSKHKLQAHIKSFHEGIVEVQEKTHVCTYCGKAFSRGTHLRLHENIHTKAIIYKCNTCPFSTTSRSGLLRHQRIHTAEKPFKCDECDASFNQSNSLHSHKAAKHNDERPFVCEICGVSKSFKTKYILQSHMRSHEKSDTLSYLKGRRIKTSGTEITVYDPELKCSFCPAVYRKELFLCRHIVEKHPLETVDMIPCDVCNAVDKNVFFLTRDEKKRHDENHDKIKAVPEKERVCSECGKVFQTNSSYHHHRQTHFNNVCKECGKSFSTSRTLRLHLLTVHLKSRPYKCNKCDSSFGQLTTLNTHMKVHRK
ncbi:zinc finger protein 184-like isoform X2 [Armigeres subalbatus]|uniref:zinc finger protein 184-like isoform X2 n=1 Tax=Armigeres subalbatus TaxID=124917 RepID=UPI002ED587F8